MKIYQKFLSLVLATHLALTAAPIVGHAESAENDSEVGLAIEFVMPEKNIANSVSSEAISNAVNSYMSYLATQQARSIEMNKQNRNYPVLKIDETMINYVAAIAYSINYDALTVDAEQGIASVVFRDRIFNDLMTNILQGLAPINSYNQEALRAMEEEVGFDQSLLVSMTGLCLIPSDKEAMEYAENTMFTIVKDGRRDNFDETNNSYDNLYAFVTDASSSSETRFNIKMMTAGADVILRQTAGLAFIESENVVLKADYPQQVPFFFKDRTNMNPDDETLTKAEAALTENVEAVENSSELMEKMNYLYANINVLSDDEIKALNKEIKALLKSNKEYGQNLLLYMAAKYVSDKVYLANSVNNLNNFIRVTGGRCLSSEEYIEYLQSKQKTK